MKRLTGQRTRVRYTGWAQSEYAGEQARGTGERSAGDGEMDELVRVATGVTRERHRRPSNCTCDRAVLLHKDVNGHESAGALLCSVESVQSLQARPSQNGNLIS